MNETLPIDTPRWATPLLAPARYKGARGGRSSGKSHFFAEMLVEDHVRDPDLQSVCIREIQKSLKFSAKKLVETKIETLGVSHLFEISQTEIKRRYGNGIIIFQGMQDHTADSIKSLEGFHRAWVEEAQSLSHRSVELLVPTIRHDGSQIWFSWNPDQPTDAVEKLFEANESAVLVNVNYTDNPWCPDEMRRLAQWQKKTDFERYTHIWEGGYNTKSDAQILIDKWRVAEFDPDPETWDGPYHGIDFGFAQDPTTANRCWIHNETLYIEYEANKIGLELDATAGYIKERIPGIEKYPVRADSARPESISYLKRTGLPKIVGVKKWPNSVEEGIQHLRSYREIVIHSRCKETMREAQLYRWKTDKQTGDILPVPVDEHNHHIDGVRYALQPLIRKDRFTWGPA